MDTLRGAICLNFLFLSSAGKSAFVKRETGGLEAGETEGEERRERETLMHGSPWRMKRGER